MNKTIGFIGGGNMAQAIIRGLLNAGHAANQIAIAEPNGDQVERLSALSPDLIISHSNTEIAECSDVVVLATKPQYIAVVAEEIAATKPALVISIAAGITLATIEASIGSGVAVVRNMPNQPSVVGLGMTGLIGNASVDSDAHEAADYIAKATGEVVWLENESLMDAITAISGSGPAYLYLVMEMLAAGAEDFGFSKDIARKLAVQTALGAASLANSDDTNLAELRRRVTSPGGTTEAAINSLESSGIRNTFEQALKAARNRSIELGKG